MDLLHLQGARVIDPAQGRDEVADLWIDQGRIRWTAPPGAATGRRAVDLRGKIVAPGFIDMHVHLREPGLEDRETIATGTRAAAAGGFTSVCPMPDTQPAIDSQTGLKFVMSRAQSDAVVNVFPVATVTKGREGREIAEFGDLIGAGAVAFSDDESSIMSSEIMRRALEYCSMFGVPVLAHCEDVNLAEGGVVREGGVSVRLGLRGWPAAAESIMVARDIDLAEFTGGRLHVCQVSCASSIGLIRRAKERGVRVTCDVTPHHLTLTDQSALGYSTHAKCSPPLAPEFERELLVEALADGTIDAVATDHSPQTAIEKDFSFADAPSGVIGLETAFGVLHTRLVRAGRISLPTLIARMSAGPASILKLDRGTLAEGAEADLAILDPEARWTVDASKFESKARNCPWDGEELTGRVWGTIVGGDWVVREGKLLK